MNDVDYDDDRIRLMRYQDAEAGRGDDLIVLLDLEGPSCQPPRVVDRWRLVDVKYVSGRWLSDDFGYFDPEELWEALLSESPRKIILLPAGRSTDVFDDALAMSWADGEGGTISAIVFDLDQIDETKWVRYECPGCGTAVRGGARLNVVCGDCGETFRSVTGYRDFESHDPCEEEG
jgi:hypothetical protein